MGRPTRDRATLKDVAAAANVSVMTVSNVVNGRLEFVSERTRAVVQREIERLNYHAVGSARALRSGKSRTVGVLLVENALDERFGSRELDVAFRSFCHAMGAKGYNVTLVTKTAATAQDVIPALSATVDGLCVMTMSEDAETVRMGTSFAGAAKPVAVCTPAPADATLDPFMAFVDDASAAGGRTLAAYLHGVGITHLTVLETSFVSASVARRHAGLIAEGTSRGLSVSTHHVRKGSDTLLPRMLAADQRLCDPAQCIVALNEVQAQSIMLELMATGYAVPRDVQVACLNLAPVKPYRTPDGKSAFNTAITGIWSDAWRVGAAAASMLLAAFANGGHTHRTVSIDCVLKEGTTTRRVRPRLVEGGRAG